MGCKFILFDADGTLVDSGSAWRSSFVKVMTEETGRPVSPEEYISYWGVPGIETFKRMGVTEGDRIAAGLEKWNRYFHEIQQWSPPFPGIEGLLAELTERGFVLGVVTSKDNVEFEADFRPSPIFKYLPHYVTANDTEHHKPHPEPLLTMLDRLKAPKKECLYIGDTVLDSQCAEAAGVDFALACWGFLFGEPEGVRAIGKLKTPGDVLKLIEARL